MALKYFKLGPLSDQFFDSSLGAFLIQGNAFSIDDSYYSDERLINFILSGFIIEIKLSEFSHIQVNASNPKNIPSYNEKVNSKNILQPVDFISNVAPDAPLQGQNILIGINASGIWFGLQNQIAYFDGSNWNYYIPLNGNTINVRISGTSTHYIGTYPSGYWDYINKPNITLNSSNPVSTPSVDPSSINDALNAEIQTRQTQYNQLLASIQGLTPGQITAAQVSVADSIDQYNIMPKTAESILGLIGQMIKSLQISVANGINTVNGLNIPTLQSTLLASILFKGQWVNPGSTGNSVGYGLGYYYIYGGKLWVSNINNNLDIPGTTSTYSEVLTGYSNIANPGTLIISIPRGSATPIVILCAGGGSTPFTENDLTNFGDSPELIVSEILATGLDGNGNSVVTKKRERTDIQPERDFDPLTGNLISITLNVDENNGLSIDNLELNIK